MQNDLAQSRWNIRWRDGRLLLWEIVTITEEHFNLSISLIVVQSPRSSLGILLTFFTRHAVSVSSSASLGRQSTELECTFLLSPPSSPWKCFTGNFSTAWLSRSGFHSLRFLWLSFCWGWYQVKTTRCFYGDRLVCYSQAKSIVLESFVDSKLTISSFSDRIYTFEWGCKFKSIWVYNRSLT